MAAVRIILGCRTGRVPGRSGNGASRLAWGPGCTPRICRSPRLSGRDPVSIIRGHKGGQRETRGKRTDGRSAPWVRDLADTWDLQLWGRRSGGVKGTPDRFMFLWTSPSTPQHPVQLCLKLGSEQPQLLASEAWPKGSDEKECRKCEVWLNLENDPGDWRNGGVQSWTGIEALELSDPRVSGISCSMRPRILI